MSVPGLTANDQSSQSSTRPRQHRHRRVPWVACVRVVGSMVVGCVGWIALLHGLLRAHCCLPITRKTIRSQIACLLPPYTLHAMKSKIKQKRNLKITLKRTARGNFLPVITFRPALREILMPALQARRCPVYSDDDCIFGFIMQTLSSRGTYD